MFLKVSAYTSAADSECRYNIGADALMFISRISSPVIKDCSATIRFPLKVRSLKDTPERRAVDVDDRKRKAN